MEQENRTLGFYTPALGEYMFVFLISTLTALVLSLGFTPLMIAASRKLKIMDMPNSRKAHCEPMPLMGGVAIYLATIAATVLFIIFFVEGLKINIVIAFLIGISGVTMMGLIDDILSLSAKRRLVILFILAFIILIGCLQFYFPADLLHTNLALTLLTSFIVVLWIVAITNAINLSDGLDGLASSLSLVSVAAFALIFYLQGRTQLALPTALALFGAIAGFLPYNISPAKIFMGDAGSMFIGFMLGILSIMSMSQKPIDFFVVPVFLILMPILDMAMSILRRMLLRRPVMQPDKMHFHHALNKRFKSHRVVVLILAAFQLVFAAMGVAIYLTEWFTAGWTVLICIGLGAILYTMATARKIRIKEKTKSVTAKIPAEHIPQKPSE
jgi:UDP-GlcNAc:undecaprenyl-phosphate GlcNAc-1-phosphate transferase